MKFSVRCSVLALSLPLFLAACGGGSDLYTPRIVSSVAQTIEAVPSSSATLLTHTMQAVAGGETNATSLLFVPSGTPPAGGWPLVAWAHGTTSVAKASCAPSQTPQYLDGGLTAEGFRATTPPSLHPWSARVMQWLPPILRGWGLRRPASIPTTTQQVSHGHSFLLRVLPVLPTLP